VSPIINEFELANDRVNSIIRKSSRESNALYFVAEKNCSTIWSKYNGATGLEGIQDQIKNLRKTPIPQLPTFDDAAGSVLDAIDRMLKMT